MCPFVIVSRNIYQLPNHFAKFWFNDLVLFRANAPPVAAQFSQVSCIIEILLIELFFERCPPKRTLPKVTKIEYGRIPTDFGNI